MSPASSDGPSASAGPHWDLAGRRRPWLIGMVHLLPLPGSPRYGGSLERIFDRAVADLDALESGGADGAIIENFGDAPFYPGRVPPETIAAMTAAAALLRANVPEKFLLGINVLRNDAAAAMSIATVIGAGFIRVNVHTSAVIADQGIIVGTAHETLRLREALRSRVRIFADVGVKHATPLSGRGVESEARDAVERGLADGILMTGPRTGSPVDADSVISVRRAIPGIPLMAASGIVPDLATKLAPHCDGFVVGTWLKKEGRIGEPVDLERVRALSSLLRRIRA